MFNLRMKNYLIGALSVFIVLFYPVFFFEISTETLSLNHLISSSIYILPLLFIIGCITNKLLFRVAMFLFFVMNSVEIVMIMLYHSFVKTGNIVAVFNTNINESKGFLGQVGPCLLVIFPLFVFLLFAIKYKKFFCKIKRNISLFCVVLLVNMFFVSYQVYSKTYEDTYYSYINNNFFKRPPYNFLFQSYSFVDFLMKRELIKDSDKLNFGAVHGENKENEIYVLAIGETVNYEHLSICGYSRTTTPNLDTLHNVTLLTDYYSTSNLTSYSVPQIITRATPLNLDLSYKEKSLFKPFKECGFKTFAISNDNVLAYKNWEYLTNGVDSLFVVKKDEKIHQIVDSLCNIYPKIFLLLHYWGNHSQYDNFDKRCDVYHPNPKSDRVDWNSKKAMINAYDNTILYTDYNIMRVIKSIDRPNTVSSMFFVPDHGEDFSYGLCGHGFSCNPSKEEYHVPLIIWNSNCWKVKYINKALWLKKNKSRPLNCDNVFYSFCDMADIKLSSKYSADSLSFFSQKLKDHERLLLTPDGVNVIKLK